MKIAGKCQHVPQIFCAWTGWPTTSLMAFSMGWHFWVCPEIITYILCSLMHCEKEASLVNVRQETGEHNDVIQTCSGLTLFCYGTESGYKHKSWWRLIPSACAAPDRNWASLTLSSLDSLNEWAVRGCQKSVLLCRECRIFSRELPYIHNLISAVASGAPWSLISCGVCGTWRPQGAIDRRGEEGRMIWKQLSATVIVALSWLFSKGGIILLWQKPQPIGTELLIDKQLYLSFAFAG